MQEDYALISSATGMVVQYFDTVVYRGDDSVDSNTCKIHSQLHTHVIDYFGNPMQYNTETGEHGLKDWAKGVSRMALPQAQERRVHPQHLKTGRREDSPQHCHQS